MMFMDIVIAEMCWYCRGFRLRLIIPRLGLLRNDIAPHPQTLSHFFLLSQAQVHGRCRRYSCPPFFGEPINLDLQYVSPYPWSVHVAAGATNRFPHKLPEAYQALEALVLVTSATVVVVKAIVVILLLLLLVAVLLVIPVIALAILVVILMITVVVALVILMIRGCCGCHGFCCGCGCCSSSEFFFFFFFFFFFCFFFFFFFFFLLLLLLLLLLLFNGTSLLTPPKCEQPSDAWRLEVRKCCITCSTVRKSRWQATQR